MSSLRGVTIVVSGIALLVLQGCGGESRRTGSDAQEAEAEASTTEALEAEASEAEAWVAEAAEAEVSAAEAEVSAAEEATMEQGGTTSQKPEKVAEPLTKTSSQEWTRIQLKSFKLARDGETVTLTVQASAPSAGWKVEIRPIAQTEEMLAEYEVVGLPPQGAAAAVIEEKTVTYSGKIGDDVRQVLVHGKGGALFPD